MPAVGDAGLQIGVTAVALDDIQPDDVGSLVLHRGEAGEIKQQFEAMAFGADQRVAGRRSDHTCMQYTGARAQRATA